MGYSAEEIKSFERKDRRIVRQNALSHATKLVVETSESGTDPQELVEVIKNFAEQFVDWVYEAIDSSAPEDENGNFVLPKELPTPTAAQQEILEIFQKKYNKTKEEIYNAWGGYPNNVGEGKKCLAMFQEKK